MTDEDFDNKDEDFASEFDFVDTKGAATPGAPQPQGEPHKNTSALVSVLVLVSILGGGYYAYSHFFGSKPAPATPPKAPTALPEPIHNAAPPMPAAEHEAPMLPPSATAEHHDELAAALPQPQTGGTKSFEQVQRDLQTAQQNPPTAMPVEIRNALQSISDEMTVNVNNIKQLEATLSSLTTTIDQLTKTVNAMDNRVLGLTETVDSLSQDLANVKKIMVDEDMDLTSPGSVKLNSKKKMQPISSSATSYSVHAIIPGRAWLKSTSGQIITVTEGDSVGELGKVAVIDASNGLVRTSSGIIIR